MIATLKKLETEFAMGAVSFIEYAIRWSMLVERINEARTPVADAAWWIVDNVGASHTWLDGAHPNDIIAERDKMKAGIERMAEVFNRGIIHPRDVLVMPFPRMSDRYLGPFAMAPAWSVVDVSVIFPEGSTDLLREDPPEIRCSVLNALYPHRQEIADKAEFLWRTTEARSTTRTVLASNISTIRKAYDHRSEAVASCADAALRLYGYGWPIHAFEGQTRGAIMNHAAKLPKVDDGASSDAPVFPRWKYSARHEDGGDRRMDSGWLAFPSGNTIADLPQMAKEACCMFYVVTDVWYEGSAQ